MKHRTVIILCLISASVATYLAGETGYLRGYREGANYARWHANYDSAVEKADLEKIGVCRWANVVANCGFADSGTRTKFADVLAGQIKEGRQ